MQIDSKAWANSTLGKFIFDPGSLPFFLGFTLVADGIGVLGSSLGEKSLWMGIGILVAIAIQAITKLVKSKLA